MKLTTRTTPNIASTLENSIFSLVPSKGMPEPTVRLTPTYMKAVNVVQARFSRAEVKTAAKAARAG